MADTWKFCYPIIRPRRCSRAENPPGGSSAGAHLPVQPPRLVHAQVPGALNALNGHGAHGHGANL